jgi:hypothetical protein
MPVNAYYGRKADLVQIDSKIRCRRIPDIADRGLERLNWAYRVPLGRTGVRAINARRQREP